METDVVRNWTWWRGLPARRGQSWRPALVGNADSPATGLSPHWSTGLPATSPARQYLITVTGVALLSALLVASCWLGLQSLADSAARLDGALALEQTINDTGDLRRLLREMTQAEEDEVVWVRDSARLTAVRERFARLSRGFDRQAARLQSHLNAAERDVLSEVLSTEGAFVRSNQELLSPDRGAVSTDLHQVTRQHIEQTERSRQLLGRLAVAKTTELAELRERALRADIAARYHVNMALLVVGMTIVGIMLCAWRVFRVETQATLALTESHVLYRRAFASTPTAIIVANQSGRILRANLAASTLFGYYAQELLNAPIGMLLPSESGAFDVAVNEHDGEHPGGSFLTVKPIVRACRRDQSAFLAEVTFSTVTSPQGELLTLSIIRDVTARQMQDEELQETHNRLNHALQHSREQAALDHQLSELVGLVQSCHVIREAAKVIAASLGSLTGAPSGALALKRSSDRAFEIVVHWGTQLGSVADSFRADDCWALRRAKAHDVRDSNSPLRCQHLTDDATGSYICVPLTAQGETFGVLSLDLSHLQVLNDELFRQRAERISAIADRLAQTLANLRLREELERQSTHDGLTGLHNRRFLEGVLEREIQRAARSGNALAVVMIDVDHFKVINDTSGHQAGDALLQAFGAMLATRTRQQDTACRYGGEEFLVLLTDVTIDGARRYAELLRQDLRAFRVHYGGSVIGPITISIGISMWRLHGTTAQELLAAADRGLYDAKTAGRDRTVALGLPEALSETKPSTIDA